MWWAYRPEQMVGYPLIAWGDTPVEELLLWSLAGWTTVVIYEAFQVSFRMERGKMRYVMFGIPKESDESDDPGESDTVQHDHDHGH